MSPARSERKASEGREIEYGRWEPLDFQLGLQFCLPGRCFAYVMASFGFHPISELLNPIFCAPTLETEATKVPL